MFLKEEEEKSKPTKEVYKKKGLKFLVIAVVLLIISFAIYSMGVQGGLIMAFVSIGWIVCLISSLFYFVKGFIGKP
jgi:FtsH-binding integral membrane protein